MTGMTESQTVIVANSDNVDPFGISRLSKKAQGGLAHLNITAPEQFSRPERVTLVVDGRAGPAA